jgi:23S rRNA pseudouridine1911/1915/1917 synthase
LSVTDQEIRTLEVSQDDAGKRIDLLLASYLTDHSRTYLKRLIEDGDVLVGGRSIKPSYKVHTGDKIEIELTTLPISTDLIPEDIPIEIIYEDEQIIVINKPAGLVVHPGAGVHSGTLANALAYHFQQLPTIGGEFRPGIVHRLDRGTSGLMVVAKTEKAHEALSEQFRARDVYKSYIALVHGRLSTDKGTIDQPIARDTNNRIRMAVVPKGRGGRTAISLYHVVERLHRFTLVKVEIKTGRTHQIRVHLAWLKHPVVGDELYGGGRDQAIPDIKLRTKISKLNRPFLHAEELQFRHPQMNEPLRFRAPLAAELKDFLDEIRLEHSVA